MKITFGEISVPDSGALAVLCCREKALSVSAQKVDEASGGAITRALGSGRFAGKKGQIMEILAPGGLGLDRIVVAGLGAGPGASDEAESLAWEQLGGDIAAHMLKAGGNTLAIAIDPIDGSKLDLAEAAARVGFGALLASYRFDRYRTKGEGAAKPALTEITILVKGAAEAGKRFAPLEAVADGVYFTRDLVSEPGNVIYPESFAARVEGLSELGVEVEVLDEAKLADLGMGALLAVGQGSARESQVVVMRWNGLGDGQNEDPVVFVGKGVTFDSGGISLKPGAGMAEMKWDMGGAGAVSGLIKALAGRQAKVHAVGVIGLVENMPSGKAQRPGDIVTSMSGQTIEVLNTDAEGRLVLADILWYAQKTLKPRAMIDLATLTGAMIIALGHHTAGLFSNDDDLAAALSAAGSASGEALWRLPLAKVYDKMIDSPIADMQNIAAGRDAGSIVAAQFLERFVNGVPWAHLDIAGVAWSKKDTPTVPKGGTGFGVRLLDRLVADHFESA